MGNHDDDDDKKLQTAAILAAGLAVSPLWLSSFNARASRARTRSADTADSFFARTLAQDAVALLNLLSQELNP